MLGDTMGKVNKRKFRLTNTENENLIKNNPR